MLPVQATPPRVGENISKLTLVFDPDAAGRVFSLPAALESEEDVTISHGTRSPAVLLFEVLTYDPDANSGWHYHPGVTLVTVADGAVDWYDANCVRHVHKAGEVFVEREWVVHLSHNSASTPARIIQTFIIRKGLSYKIPVPPPPCAAALGLH
ncbi:MAG TPA: cupin domain-containing protein [Steroidobacteraceae bacterium]|nr:cupin domain-containing protein [Steroidobacteraceae bacterium]